MFKSLKLSHLIYYGFALCGLRLLLAACLPVSQDEAYYFYWARFPDWGYFDHPPFVAWISQAIHLWPSHALAARAGTLLLSLLSLPFLLSFFRSLSLSQPSRWLLALVFATGNLAGILQGSITTPDIPLTFFWIAALAEAAAALKDQPKRWLSAGLFTGLGILGKYTMVLIGPVFLFALLAEPKRLRTPWPYAGGLVCLLTLLPHIYWLSEHEWITTRFQFGRGLKSEYGIAMQRVSDLPVAREAGLTSREATLARFFVLDEDEKPKPKRPPPSRWEKAQSQVSAFIGGQLTLWGLLLVPIGLAVARRRWNTPVWSGSSLKVLCWSSALVPLGLFLCLSPFQHIETNWPAMYLIGASALLVQYLNLTSVTVLWAAAGNGLILLAVLVHSLNPLSTKRPHRDRILKETHGYQELAAYLHSKDQVIFVDTYQNLSQIAFYQPELLVQQWPGIARTSELLRRQAMNPLGWKEISARPGFYLLTDNYIPPVIPGTKLIELQELLDCTDEGLKVTTAREEGDYVRPCARRVHRWSLAYYQVSSGDGVETRP